LVFKDNTDLQIFYKAYFPISYAKIPIIKKDGIKETKFPLIDWAKIESIKKDWRNRFNPAKV